MLQHPVEPQELTGALDLARIAEEGRRLPGQPFAQLDQPQRPKPLGVAVVAAPAEVARQVRQQGGRQRLLVQGEIGEQHGCIALLVQRQGLELTDERLPARVDPLPLAAQQALGPAVQQGVGAIHFEGNLAGRLGRCRGKFNGRRFALRGIGRQPSVRLLQGRRLLIDLKLICLLRRLAQPLGLRKGPFVGLPQCLVGIGPLVRAVLLEQAGVRLLDRQRIAGGLEPQYLPVIGHGVRA